MATTAVRFSDKYRIEAPMGVAVSSLFYAATDVHDGTPVILRLLRTELLPDQELRRLVGRFEREAEIGLRLSHPAVLKVWDYGPYDGVPCLVTERPDHARWLGDLLDREGPLPIDECLQLMVKVLGALEFIHSAGIVHGDLRPSAILVERDGPIRLSGFGLARLPEDPPDDGPPLGSLWGLSPEHLARRGIDARTDLYAAGQLLHRLLTGRPPGHGQVGRLIARVLAGDWELPSKVDSRVPPDLDPIVLTALARRSEERYARARDFAAVLRRAALLAGSTPSSWRARYGPAAAGGRGDRPVAAAAARAAWRALTGPTLPQRPARLAETCRTLLDQIAATLAGLATRPLDAAGLAALETMIADWLGHHARLSERLVGSVDASHVVLRARMVELCLGGGLEPIARAIIDQVPLPEVGAVRPRADLALLVRLFVRLRAALAGLGASERVEPIAHTLSDTLSLAYLAWAHQLEEELRRRATVDVVALSVEFVRLDQLRSALAALEATAASDRVRQTMLALAGVTIGRIDEILHRVVGGAEAEATPAPSPRADTAILSDAEELLMIAARLLNQAGPPPGRPEAPDSAPHGLDPQVIDSFLGHARMLCDRIAVDLSAALPSLATGAADTAAAPDAAADFTARLRQLRNLVRFTTQLPTARSADAAHRFSRQVHAVVWSLGETLIRAVHDGVAGTEGPLGAIIELAEDLGWQVLVETLLLRLARAEG